MILELIRKRKDPPSYDVNNKRKRARISRRQYFFVGIERLVE
jgi:hypothetical protein